jgi:DNA ligase-1
MLHPLQILLDDLDKLHYPLYVTEKIDGARCAIIKVSTTKTVPASKAGKLFRNVHVNRLLSGLPVGLDGEIVVSDSPQKCAGTLNAQSASIDGLKYYLFDCINTANYEDRQKDLVDTYNRIIAPNAEWKKHIEIVPNYLVQDAKGVRALFDKTLSKEYPFGEGLVLRDPKGFYRFGRATMKNQLALKLKAVDRKIARVVSIKPLVTHAGTVHKEVGSLRCVCDEFDSEFDVGTGFTDIQRRHLFTTIQRGDFIVFQHKIQGSLNAPCQPVFIKYLGAQNHE